MCQPWHLAPTRFIIFRVRVRLTVPPTVPRPRNRATFLPYGPLYPLSSFSLHLYTIRRSRGVATVGFDLLGLTGDPGRSPEALSLDVSFVVPNCAEKESRRGSSSLCSSLDSFRYRALDRTVTRFGCDARKLEWVKIGVELVVYCEKNSRCMVEFERWREERNQVRRNV